MLFDELTPKRQEILKRVFNFEPDEVNAMFKTVGEIDDLIYAGSPATGKKAKTSAAKFTDDGEEDGEIDLTLSKAEQAVIREAHTAAQQKGFKPEQRVTSKDMSEVQRLISSMKEADDLDDDDLDE